MKKLFIAVIVLCIYCESIAQISVTNNGVIHISTSSDVISLNGSLTNNASASLTNNGNLYVQGNITNAQSGMSVGTGTLYLNGTSAQSINGSQPFRTFNLNTNNANGITLNNNLHVSGLHTFTNGRIVTSSTPNFLVYEAGSSYTGDADARHVNGWVKKLGNTNFTFPVGNGTYLRGIALTGISSVSEFEARYHQVTPNANNMDLPLKSINPNEYWTVNKISGGTASVVMNWNHAKVAFPNYIVNDLKTARYGTAWTSQGGTATGTATTTGTITSNAMSTFGLMVLGSASFVVPLDFLDVTAKRRNNLSVIEWKTANEIDVRAYEVQRGLTPTLFNSIGSVQARNLQTEQAYLLNDANHTSGTAYYRIKSIDNNGAVKYSKVVSLNLNGKAAQPVLLTNPAKSKLVLLVPENYAAYQYELTNTAGQLIVKGEAQRQSNLLTIDLPSIPTGAYHLRVIYSGNVFNQKVIIQ